MKKYYETKDFKMKEKAAYKKLKGSGFNDIESKFDRNTGHVNRERFKVEPGNVFYFEKCSTYLNSGKIKDKIDLFIFEKHCEGLSTVKISKLLREFKFRPLTQRAVYGRLVRILGEAGIEPMSFEGGI